MIDFHMHSLYSDGNDTPASLVRKACRRGLRAIALTDHDTVAGLQPFLNNCRTSRIEGITGFEMEAEYSAGQMHILGYGFNHENPDLFQLLELQRSYRAERNQAMLTRISRDLVSITPEELQTAHKSSVIGRPHIAAMLVKKKKASSMMEAFHRYLGQDRPYYYQMRRQKFPDIAKAVSNAGGITVLAHPHTLKLEIDELERLLVKLKSEGLQGIEAFHPETELSWAEKLITLAEKLELAITGGSDYHGKRRHRRLGRGPQKAEIGDRFYYSLKERLDRLVHT